MAISSIRFSRNLGNIVPAIALFCLLYSVVLILLYRFSGRRNRPYEPVVLTSYLSNDAENIISILGKKYCEPDFSMKQLMLETRLAEDRIRTVLKKVYNKTMKEYITDVRITESKRLLRNTDRPISEIATAVGYKHVSSFNHIFKEIEHVSPREYRKTSI